MKKLDLRFNAYLFCAISILIFCAAKAYIFYGAHYLDKSRQDYKLFYADLNNQLNIKAGALIESNNLPPLAYQTLLRTYLRMPAGYIQGYRYSVDKGLEINISQTQESVIVLSDVIDYVGLSQQEDSAWVKVEGI